MSNHIFEELPARKHAPASAPVASAAKPKGKEKGGQEQSSEKRIRQAVYDIRYRARREDIDLKQAFSQYMSNSSLNPTERRAVSDKLFGKKGSVSEQYSTDGLDMAVSSIANAMYKVFAEEKGEEVIELEYQNQLDEENERVYHVRVTDPKNNRTYTRNATREKITQLRAKGLKVEMSEYRDSRDKSKPSGKPGRLDPVGREDKDIDNDGDHDKTDKYLLKRRKAIGKAIATRNEDYLWSEGTTSVEPQNKTKITGNGVDNSSRIRVFPDDGSNPQNNGGITQAESVSPFNSEMTKGEQKFLKMLEEKKLSKKQMKKREKYVKGMKKSKGDFEKRYGEDGESVMYATATKMAKKDVKEEKDGPCTKCGKSPCECREQEGYRIALKNKFRAMGMKNPIIMGDMDQKRFNTIMTKTKVGIEDACS
jgi:hypothetical protein